MGKDILIRLEIPILTYDIVATPAMIFSRWMPLTEEEFIIVQEENATLKLWFDRTCLGHVSDVHDISRHTNVLVSKVFADVTLHSLPDELVEYILVTASRPHPEPGPFQEKYAELGERVYLLTLTHLNRLISYMRSLKGQYWLQEYPVDEGKVCDINVFFKAKVLVDSEWVRWFPTHKGTLRIRDGGSRDERRFVDKSTWLKAKEFVASPERTPLVWELLAGAEWLAGIGHRRSALTEAVTALEAAIFGFAGAPKAQEAFGPLVTERMNVTSLKKWVKHMGLSGTVHYLFPVIFSEDRMPTDLLKGCQEAVQRRQNVVHSSTPQRDVQEDKLARFLFSIREVCAILETYQDV